MPKFFKGYAIFIDWLYPIEYKEVVMQVKQAMSKKPEFLPPTATIKEAAMKMQKLDCGFIPVGKDDKLIGTLTDRDIVLRAIAKGKNPESLTIQDVMSKHVEYCFETDDLKKAVNHMQDKQIHRLIVLNSNKRMTGILSLGDIARQSKDDALCAEAVEGILEDTHKTH